MQPTKPAAYTTTKNIIRQNYKEEWMNGWAKNTTGRAVYNHMKMLNLRDNIKNPSRTDQVSVFRLRTQHLPLNYHLNRIIPEHPPLCLLCDHPYETVPHLLFQCPKLQDLRQQFLPSSPDTDITLYCSMQQLQQTCTYYYMALSRRATAQRLLE